MRINVELVDGRTGTIDLKMPCALSAWKTREIHRGLGHDPALGPHAIVRATGPDGEPVTILPSYNADGDPTYVLPNASYTCDGCGHEGESGNSSDLYGFKGAGEIGQIADVAIRIERTKENGELTPYYGIVVVKNRSGRGGEIECRIDFPSGHITQA